MDVYTIELIISGEKVFIESVCKSIEPDSKNVPEGCSITLECTNSLHLTLNCVKLSALRALFNSYFNILSALFRIKKEVQVG